MHSIARQKWDRNGADRDTHRYTDREKHALLKIEQSAAQSWPKTDNKPQPSIRWKRGLCRHAMSVRLSDTFVNSVKTNKHIFKIFRRRVAEPF